MVFADPSQFKKFSAETQALSLAQKQLDDKRYDEAIRTLEALKGENSSADYYYMLGCAYDLNGNAQHELEAFENAINIDDRHHKAFSAGGHLFAQAGQPLQAADCFACAIRVSSGNLQCEAPRAKTRGITLIQAALVQNILCLGS